MRQGSVASGQRDLHFKYAISDFKCYLTDYQSLTPDPCFTMRPYATGPISRR
jgi:hypothetical protein